MIYKLIKTQNKKDKKLKLIRDLNSITMDELKNHALYELKLINVKKISKTSLGT